MFCLIQFYLRPFWPANIIPHGRIFFPNCKNQRWWLSAPRNGSMGKMSAFDLIQKKWLLWQKWRVEYWDVNWKLKKSKFVEAKTQFNYFLCYWICTLSTELSYDALDGIRNAILPRIIRGNAWNVFKWKLFYNSMSNINYPQKKSFLRHGYVFHRGRKRFDGVELFSHVAKC